MKPHCQSRAPQGGLCKPISWEGSRSEQQHLKQFEMRTKPRRRQDKTTPLGGTEPTHQQLPADACQATGYAARPLRCPLLRQSVWTATPLAKQTPPCPGHTHRLPADTSTGPTWLPLQVALGWGAGSPPLGA